MTWGHCAKRFDKWGVLAAHFIVPGLDVEKACKPCFKVPQVSSPTFTGFQSRVQKAALQATGTGTKVPKTQIQYNSWQNVHPRDIKALRCYATRVRTGGLCALVVVSPVRASTEDSLEGISLQTAPVVLSDVEPDDPPLLRVETPSSLLPRRSSTCTVTSATVSSAPVTVASRRTLFEAIPMAPPVTEVVQGSIPQASLLVQRCYFFQLFRIIFRTGQTQLLTLIVVNPAISF